jgi:regulator of protease activity HflC (stomatin/prohibitin superfamily)
MTPADGDPRLPGRLLGAAGAALGVAVVATGVQHAFDRGSLAPLAAYLVLLTVVLYASARAARLRAVAAADAERTREAWTRLARERVAFAFSIAGAASLALVYAAWQTGLGSGPAGRLTVLLATLLGVLTFTLMVGSRWMAAMSGERLPEAPALAEWLRGAQWIAALTALGLLAAGLPFVAFDPGRAIAVALLALSVLCAAELWLRGLDAFFGRRAAGPATALPVRLVTLTTLFRGASPLHGLMDVAEQRLGLSLRSAWAVGVVRRSLGGLAAGVLLLVWASTMLVVVGPHEQGLRLRFGRLVARAPVLPGLHVKWPWPLERVARYPVTRVQTLALGYAGAPKESLLWARRHAGEEYQLLLGDGRELVSVDATVSYRIRDVLAFALGSQTPRETLEALAYRLLMGETVATDLDRLLTADRATFARRFSTALQQAADLQGLGLEILHVAFTSLHPPVGIASAYEDVVSAEIERETHAARARVAQETALPAAEAEAVGALREAEADAARRLADAHGAASAFRAALGAARSAPELFRFRRRLEALEDGLADRSLFVVDHRLRKGGGELWIDVRPGTPAPTPFEVRPGSAIPTR